MFNVRLASGHLYGKQLFTWLSLVVSLMASFVLSFFPLDVLDEIWDLIESVSEGFLTYSDVITVGDSQLTSGRRKTLSKFKCLYTNAQSIVKKHLELEALVDIHDPDIIGITETWLNNKVSDKEYCIEGYQKPVRQDRLDTKDGRGGGVMLFIKNDIDFIQIFPENSEHFFQFSMD